MRWWHIDAVMPIEEELFGAESWSARALWSELAQSDSRHYLIAGDADSDDPVRGYAGLGVFGDEGWILTLGVRGADQHRGIGTQLLRALLAEAGRRGATSVLLEVRADNPVAQGLYERHGFRPIGLRKGYYQPSGTDAVVMRCDAVANSAGDAADERD
jgi:[ribosomal protein S18]-alanine N-acetyltransferase